MVDELESVWDPDDDSPASDDDGHEREDEDEEAEQSPPSSSEMAGDGAVGGDGIDEPGWD
jgi:hypothetical protein